MVNDESPWQTITNEVLYGLRNHEAGNVRGVILIHGFTGKYDETWVNPTTKASFGHLLREDPELGDYDVFSFRYRTHGLGGTAIKVIANQLADVISTDLRRYRQLILVTHSMGGVVAMRYVLDQVSRGRDTPIEGLLLYGAPINGSYLVPMAQAAGVILKFALPKGGGLFSWLLNLNPQLKQLEPASDFLQDLNDEWALRVVNGGHASVEAQYRILLPVRVVTGTTDFVVKEVSAKGTYGSIDWHQIDCGHRDLVKPEGYGDGRYKKAKEFLQRCRHGIDRYALLRLRQISDRMLEIQSARVCKNWDFRVQIHGGWKYKDDDELIQCGFSPYVVTRCRYEAILEAEVVHFGFASGIIAVDQAWDRKPIYIHQILTRELPEAERNLLSRKIDEILQMERAEDSWNTIFPELKVSITPPRDKRHELAAGSIERDGSSLLRGFAVPKDLRNAVGNEVTYDIEFKSYGPRGSKSFTLVFPWLHVRFDGLITVHKKCTAISVSQFLAGEKELESTLEYSGHKAQLRLKTDDIVLPEARVEVSWEVTTE